MIHSAASFSISAIHQTFESVGRDARPVLLAILDPRRPHPLLDPGTAGPKPVFPQSGAAGMVRGASWYRLPTSGNLWATDREHVVPEAFGKFDQNMVLSSSSAWRAIGRARASASWADGDGVL